MRDPKEKYKIMRLQRRIEMLERWEAALRGFIELRHDDAEAEQRQEQEK